MNNRIDELFGQALDETVPETWTTMDKEQLAKLKAKFAELIVRECADLAWNGNPHFTFEQRISRAIALDIKKHFGIDQ